MLIRVGLLWIVCISLSGTIHNVNCDAIDDQSLEELCTKEECAKDDDDMLEECLDVCLVWEYPTKSRTIIRSQNDESLNTEMDRYKRNNICDQICQRNPKFCDKWCKPNGFNQTATCTVDFCITEPHAAAILCGKLCRRQNVCNDENCKEFPELRKTVCYGKCPTLHPDWYKGDGLPRIWNVLKDTSQNDMARAQSEDLCSTKRSRKAAEDFSKDSSDSNLWNRYMLLSKYQANRSGLKELMVKCKCFTPQQLPYCHDICVTQRPFYLNFRKNEPGDNLNLDQDKCRQNPLFTSTSDNGKYDVSPICNKNFCKYHPRLAVRICKNSCRTQQVCTLENCQQFPDLKTEVCGGICLPHQNRKLPRNLPIPQLPQAETECLDERRQFDQKSCSFHQCFFNPSGTSCNCTEFTKQRLCTSAACERSLIIKTKICGGVCGDTILETTNRRMFRAKDEENECSVENCFDLKKEDRCWKMCQEILKPKCSPQLCRLSAYFRRICGDDCKGKKSKAE